MSQRGKFRSPTTAESARFEVPSYTRTDASIFYNRGKFRAALNFKNLFDVNYFENVESDLRVRFGAPFTVIGSISFEL
ncbi:TonB-dependent receptor [Acaryochloris sp. 'Moss Beach']|uniref:TonB-dependent receptor n=1 Tax=Acaryochloris sp. 'Moss Beach' TaxID=2740837 RepID=UPI001F290E2B|nr:TonB-dependent receptor [Acaryochloris sp. 'Moss Beach']UJB67724.1 TonB-dependent receptor [Acaryochloris sp. 'Moss Beach']